MFKKLLTILFILLITSTSYAVTGRTWTGAGADNNWGTIGNWASLAGSRIPDTTNEYASFFGTTRRTPNVQVSGYNIARIELLGTNFTISGQFSGYYILLAGDDGVGNVVVNATAPQATNTLNVVINLLPKPSHYSIADDNTLIQSRGIVGGGTLVKTGNGNLILSAVNTYSGDTIISNGVLSITTTSSIPSTTSLYIENGATNDLNFTGRKQINKVTLGGTNMYSGIFSAATYPAYFTGSGELYVAGGTWTNLVGGNWSDSNNWANGLISSDMCAIAYFTNTVGVTVTNDYLALTNASFYFTNANYTITGGTNVLDCFTATSTITVAGSKTATINTKLTGTNTLFKSGNGTLILNNTNIYTGGTVLRAGILRGSNSNSFSTGTIILGDTQSDTNAITLWYPNNIVVTNAILVTANGGTTAIAAGDYSGPITINKSIVVPSGSVGDFDSYGGISGTGDLLVSASGGWSARLGHWTSGGVANTFTGNVYVATNATLNIGGGYLSRVDLLPNTAILSVTGTVNILFGGTNETVDTLIGTGSVTLGPGDTLTVGGNNGSSIFNGIISSSGGIVKMGTGEQTLSGKNTYSGPTTISGGILNISSSGYIGSGNYTGNLVNNSKFYYNSTANQILRGVVSGTGVVIKANSSTLTINSTNTSTGELIISNGTVSVNGAISNITTVVNQGTLNGTGKIYNIVTNTGTISAGTNDVVGSLTMNDLILQTNSTIEIFVTPTAKDLLIITNNLTLESNITISVKSTGNVFGDIVVANYKTLSGITNNFNSWSIRGVYNMIPVIDTLNNRLILRVDNDGYKIPLEQPKNLQRNKLMKIRR